MDRAQGLIDEFKPFGVARGSEIYFCRRTALDIIERCEQLELNLYGIDGAYLTATSTEEPIEWILDLSQHPANYMAARDYISAGKAEPLFYQFVISDPLHDREARRD